MVCPALVKKVVELGLDRVGADPEGVAGRFGHVEAVLGLAFFFLGKVGNPVAAGELIFLDLVVPPGVAIHGRSSGPLAFDPDRLGHRDGRACHHQDKEQRAAVSPRWPFHGAMFPQESCLSRAIP